MFIFPLRMSTLHRLSNGHGPFLFWHNTFTLRVKYSISFSLKYDITNGVTGPMPVSDSASICQYYVDFNIYMKYMPEYYSATVIACQGPGVSGLWFSIMHGYEGPVLSE